MRLERTSALLKKLKNEFIKKLKNLDGKENFLGK